MTTLARTDGLAVLLAALRSDGTVLAEFGSADAVTGLVEPPYPHLAVTAGGTDVDDSGWRSVQEAQIAVYADRQRSPGSAELRRLLAVAIEVARGLPDRTYLDDEPVVTFVQVGSGPLYLPETGGSDRWLATVRLHMHPPRT